MLFIGIDLGTSSTKLLLVNENGEVLNIVSREYPISFPRPGWSEQCPEDWWEACVAGIPQLLYGFDAAQVVGIGVAGQMHGLVILDDQDQVIRPAILWNDSRTEEQTEYLNNVIGKDRLSEWTANIAFAGFTAPKLLWLQKYEPQNFKKISKIMLPKDYINYRLTGVHCTDYSDASGTLLLDVANKCWSKEMLELCGVGEIQMPHLFESFSPIGTLFPEIANAFGLRKSVVVAAGAGDNAAAAIGTGTVGKGNCNISLGTSGTIFISSQQFFADTRNALHTFAHADGGYHLMGCMLSAASCNKWLMEDIFKTQNYATEQASIAENRLGRNSVFFLPYLMGERSPINDTKARGIFIGMTMDTSRADLTQAVLEGVAFAIRDSLEVVRELGIKVTKSTICGGGAKSPMWKRIMANILQLELHTTDSEQGPGIGGAILAMVACGIYPSVAQACEKLITISETIPVEPNLASLYEERYQQFRQIYPACKGLFPILNVREEKILT